VLDLGRSQEAEMIRKLINENEEQLTSYISSIKDNMEGVDPIIGEVEK